MKAGKRKPPAKPAPVAFALKTWHILAGVFAALAVTIAVYQPALNGPFLFDDQYLPIYSPDFAEKPLLVAIRGVRPLLMFSFWLNHRVSGLNPGSYHLFNVLFHIASGLLVFFILRRILGWAEENGARREALSAFGAAVFLLHPVQTESVAYVASRSEALSVLFFHAAFALFLYRRATSVSWPVAAGVLVLYAAAASTKEHTVVLPALLLLTDYFWNPGFSFQGIRRNWRLYAPLLLAGLVGLRFVRRVLAVAATAGFGMRDLPWHQYFFTQCRAIWQYLRLFLIPVGQNADYQYPVSRTIFDRGAIFGLVALLVAVACALYLRRRFPLACYGFLAALVLFAPTSSVIPIADTLVERRIYLPVIGLLLVVLEFLRRWKTSAARLAAACAIVLVAASALAWRRNTVWGSEVALWEDTAAKAPHNSRALFQLGMAYYAEGRCSDAAARYAEVARVGESTHRLLVDWALAEDCLGRSEAALDKLQQAARLNATAHVYSLIGMIHGKAGRSGEALEAIETAIQIDPKYDMAYFYRGNVRATAGDWAAAAEDYRHALRLNAHNPLARQSLLRAEANLGSPSR
jgi:tetratricopeptide (TPR) repeat protein